MLAQQMAIDGKIEPDLRPLPQQEHPPGPVFFETGAVTSNYNVGWLIGLASIGPISVRTTLCAGSWGLRS